jgi:glucose/arabinose dehydrogenase
MYLRLSLPFAFLAVALTACGEVAQFPVAAGLGANPQLPPPKPTLAPTVNIAPAKGWPKNGKPAAALGMAVNAYADGLDHPRWLYVLPKAIRQRGFHRPTQYVEPRTTQWLSGGLFPFPGQASLLGNQSMC